MLDYLTVQQLEEWQAFDRIEPIGDYSRDVVIGEMAAMIQDNFAALGGNKKKKRTDPREMVWYLKKTIADKVRKSKIADPEYFKTIFGMK